jgi:SOS-response transcriptional repressor LexA
MELSAKATQVLEFIEDYHAKQSIAPTIREIGMGCGLSSTSLVAHYLNQLEFAHKIKRYPNTPRGIVLQNGSNGNGQS